MNPCLYDRTNRPPLSIFSLFCVVLPVLLMGAIWELGKRLLPLGWLRNWVYLHWLSFQKFLSQLGTLPPNLSEIKFPSLATRPCERAILLTDVGNIPRDRREDILFALIANAATITPIQPGTLILVTPDPMEYIVLKPGSLHAVLENLRSLPPSALSSSTRFIDATELIRSMQSYLSRPAEGVLNLFVCRPLQPPSLLIYEPSATSSDCTSLEISRLGYPVLDTDGCPAEYWNGWRAKTSSAP